MAPKRRRDDGGGGGSKKRWQSSGGGKGPVIPAGSRGFLVSCVTGKEMLASREAIDLLGQYMETPKAEQPEAGAAGADISALIAEEVADIQSGAGQPLTWHKTNITGLLYLALDKSAGVGPVELAQRMATDIQATKQCKSRLCLRFMPVEHVCSSNLDAMKKLAGDVLPKALPAREEGAEPETIAVQYEHRASTDLKRMDVINCFVDHVPKGYKVDLDKPTHTILVQLVKSCCTLAIVPKYRELLKFNVRELSGCGDAAAAAANKASKPAEKKDSNQTEVGKEGAEAKAEAAAFAEATATAPADAAAVADGVTPERDATSLAASTPAAEGEPSAKANPASSAAAEPMAAEPAAPVAPTAVAETAEGDAGHNTKDSN